MTRYVAGAAALASLLAGLAGTHRPRAAAADLAEAAAVPPPSPVRDRASHLLADLDALQARAERLLAQRMLAADGARALADACLSGVASVRVAPGEVRGGCRALPSLGRHAVAAPEGRP